MTFGKRQDDRNKNQIRACQELEVQELTTMRNRGTIWSDENISWLWVVVTWLCKFLKIHRRLPWWSSGKNLPLLSRGHWFDPWLGKIPYTMGQLSPCTQTTDNTTLMAESKELKSLLMKVKESEKAGLKLNIQKTKIMASSPITSWQIDGETMETLRHFIFLGSKITADGDCSHEIKRHLLLGRKSYDQPRQHIQKQRHYFTNKAPFSQGYGFSSSHVWLGELDYKESWVLKKWLFWTVVLEKTLEHPLACKEIQPVHPKGDQSWVFIGRTDAEAETPIVWPPDAKNHSLEKTLMLGKIEGRRRRGQQGWDGWMASPMRWIWVWVGSGSWWWTGKPGVLQSMGSQRVRHDWTTELTLTGVRW